MSYTPADFCRNLIWGGSGVSRTWRVDLPAQVERKVSVGLGMLLVSLAVGGVLMLLGPVAVAEIKQKTKAARLANLEEGEKEEARRAERVTFGDYLVQAVVPGNLAPAARDFALVIPKIEVNSRVIAQVDPNDPAKYKPALKQGLAQAAGSALPGGKGDMLIFGHSTDFSWNVARWNALFYNLRYLERGDKVYVVYQGKPRVYQVTGKGVYEPKDVSFLDPNQRRERLILQTCTPAGTTLRRLLVFAEPVGKRI